MKDINQVNMQMNVKLQLSKHCENKSVVLAKHAKVIPDLTGLPKSEGWENLGLTMCKSGVNNIGKKKSYIAFFFFPPT